MLNALLQVSLRRASLLEESSRLVFGTRLRKVLPEVDMGLSWLGRLHSGPFLLLFHLDHVSDLEETARG